MVMNIGQRGHDPDHWTDDGHGNEQWASYGYASEQCVGDGLDAGQGAGDGHDTGQGEGDGHDDGQGACDGHDAGQGAVDGHDAEQGALHRGVVGDVGAVGFLFDVFETNITIHRDSFARTRSTGCGTQMGSVRSRDTPRSSSWRTRRT